MNNQLTTTKGELTSYGYACGYQTTKEGSKGSKRLYKESGVFHVQAKIADIRTWHTFQTLKEAKNFYKSIDIG